MKKFISILMLIILTLSLSVTFACGRRGGGTTEKPGGDPVDNDTKQTYVDKEMYLTMFGPGPNVHHQYNVPEFSTLVKGTQFNVFMLGVMDEASMDTYFGMVYNAGKKFWLYIQDSVWVTGLNGPEIRENCYANLYSLREIMENKGWYDALLGFHIDEPLLQRMTAASLLKGSKVIHDVFPEKRFWVNFGAQAFSEDIPTSGDRMTKEAGEYITDLSYDMYGKFGDQHAEIFNTMVEMFKGENKYYWAVPMCMSYASRTFEEDAIKHLDEFYNLIKNTEGGCGMALYAAFTYPWEIEAIGNIGYYDLLVSTEEFMQYKYKKRPWSMIYSKYYDANDNPINGGYKPWTNLEAKINEIAADMQSKNAVNVEKMDTELTVGKDVTFEYDGGGHHPTVYPTYLKYTYSFKEVGGDIIFDDAPTAIGEYEMTATLPESAFRKKKTIKATFSITPATKTLLSASDITETYTTDEYSVSVNRDNLTYSFDNITYKPYVKGTKIDVSEYVVRSKYVNCLYFKDGEKAPYILPIRTYTEYSVFEFEGKAADPYSAYTLVSNKKWSGNQSSYCKAESGVGAPGRTYHYYFNNSDLVVGNKGYDISNARYLEFYMYAEEEVTVYPSFSVTGWVGTVCNDRVTVPANKWTKVTFDLWNMSNPAIKLENMILMDINTDKPVNFYLDHVIAVGL